jgi:hypothetical protein
LPLPSACAAAAPLVVHSPRPPVVASSAAVGTY